MNIRSAREAFRAGQATSYQISPLPAARVSPLRDASPLWLRRASFAVPVLGATVLGTWLAVVATQGLADPLRWPLLALVAGNVLYMALTGWPSVLGLLLHLFRRTVAVSGQPTGTSRTALLMPVHQEDPRAVFAAIEAMARSVADAGLQQVDLFVLSDTQDSEIAAAETAEFEALRARAPTGPALHYRRRTSNAGRKVGNLAEFCATWGAHYDYMIVLDADSLMGATAISTLIGLMDANPGTGIIQTVPYPVGRETLFARAQQFAARLYTPLLVQGLLFWQQSAGNYWGHNAIVRIAPFVAHCALPVLPGREPWGGEILCHDVVEAGLMRGAGWDVWVLADRLESYEALPANIVDFASRERRWCQGNLQHLGVLRHPGLRAMGRFHLAYGVLHYLAGPLVAAFLALATVDAVLGGGVARALLLGGSPAAIGLVWLSLGLLYAGKLLALLAAVADPDEARQYGGRARLLASAALEQVGAFAVSALLIAFYTKYVADLLRGGSVRWEAQPRDDRGVSWTEGWLRLRGPVLAGLAWLGVLAATDAALLAWAAPLALGLVAGLPLAILSSRTTLGVQARRLGLFLTPDELVPAPVLHAFQRAMILPEAPARARSLVTLQLAPAIADGD